MKNQQLIRGASRRSPPTSSGVNLPDELGTRRFFLCQNKTRNFATLIAAPPSDKTPTQENCPPDCGSTPHGSIFSDKCNFPPHGFHVLAAHLKRDNFLQSRLEVPCVNYENVFFVVVFAAAKSKTTHSSSSTLTAAVVRGLVNISFYTAQFS